MDVDSLLLDSAPLDSTPYPVASGVVYDVFSGDHFGGPVDYSSPIATVSGTTWTGPPLPAGSTTIFAVRARNTITGLGESNLDATIRVIIDADGVDGSNRPNPVSALLVAPGPGGTALVSWQYNPIGQRHAPTAFKVYLGPSSSPIDWNSTPAVVPYYGNVQVYNATIGTLSDGSEYVVGVVAYNGPIPGPTPGPTALVVGSSTPPGPAEGLTISIG